MVRPLHLVVCYLMGIGLASKIDNQSSPTDAPNKNELVERSQHHSEEVTGRRFVIIVFI